ncbi:hypothetical protein, partial [Mycobacterium tuberculosis]
EAGIKQRPPTMRAAQRAAEEAGIKQRPPTMRAAQRAAEEAGIKQGPPTQNIGAGRAGGGQSSRARR